MISLQQTLWPVEKTANAASSGLKNSSTFLDNTALPIHRWFRYSAGFSALWVNETIRSAPKRSHIKVLDPFAGSGSVLIEGERCGVRSIGVEAHPFVARVARTKLLWRESPGEFRKYALEILAEAREQHGDAEGYPPLIAKCFPPRILTHLDALKRAWGARANGQPLSELTWLALTSVLRICSPVGTAQWQYVLPNKTKVRAILPFKAFESQVYLMSEDMRLRQRESPGPPSQLLQEDARSCNSIPDEWASLVITSPPYANNYDYADATRLEMSFFTDISGWGDLQEAVRKYLIRSCTQHVAKIQSDTCKILNDGLLGPIREGLVEVCEKLEAERDRHGGKKPYHTMIAAYFRDLAEVWIALRRKASRGAAVCFVIGDSAPYGIHVPVDRWLGELAIAAGFKSYRFEKIRDRNIKWKNRKHRVPLKEGRLWVAG
jgi:hypothetical protein